MQSTIYIADDEKNIRELITDFLESDGYTVRAFPTGDLLFDAFKAHPCDLVILDIMMPGTDGLTICKMLREITTVPIILLTAKDSEMDYIRGITTGSDDYLTKPFKPTMLLMRVHALLRRVLLDRPEESKSADNSNEDIVFGDLRYSPSWNAIYIGNSEIPFTQTELKLLSYMIKKHDRSFSRNELLENIWGLSSDAESRVTDETLRRIRKKLLTAGSSVYVETIWGYGYKLTFNGDDL
ncbi:MAG: response regulator transcription factor [Lachnospiraceae bacterium]|nr:response regulator transcription factor [Lachnospiraceae bacterium]